MDKQKVIDYVMETPENSNPNVLKTMLEDGGSGIGNFITDGTTLIKYTLGDLVIPDGITNIETGAFEYVKANTVTIPDTVINIGNYAFRTAKDVTSVKIGKGCKTIGDDAFTYCRELVEVEFEGESGTETIGARCFKGSNISKINIPDSVTNIGEAAFGQCNNLTSIVMPSNLTSISKSVFYESSHLQEITLLCESLNSIGDQAFQACAGLESLTLYAETPPTLGTYVFASVPKTQIKIYVPASAVETYKAATGWKYYADQINAIPA